MIGRMNRRGVLHLYVTAGCPSCERAERTLRGCERIRRLVELDVLDMAAPGVVLPAAVVGGPTAVFEGMVVALGTPDCTQLAERLESLLAAAS